MSQHQRLICGEIKSFDLEKRYIHKNGRTIWVYLNCSVVEDNDGNPVHFLTYIRDITDRRLAEEALRESEDRYRNVVESQTELICRFLPDTTLTYVNDAYCRYFGKSREELIGTKYIELVPPSISSWATKEIESLVHNGGTVTNEHEVLLPDGRIGWQQWVDHAIRGPDGEILELQAIGRDITERKRAEQALLEIAGATRLFCAQFGFNVHTKQGGRLPRLLCPGFSGSAGVRRNILGKKTSEVLPADLAARIMAAFKQLDGTVENADIGIFNGDSW